DLHRVLGLRHAGGLVAGGAQTGAQLGERVVERADGVVGAGERGRRGGRMRAGTVAVSGGGGGGRVRRLELGLERGDLVVERLALLLGGAAQRPLVVGALGLGDGALVGRVQLALGGGGALGL